MTINSTINDVARRKFGDTLYELTAQNSARTRGIVEMEKLDAEDLMLDRVGSTEVQILNERNPIITPSDITWDRRRLTADRIGVAFYTDKWDTQKMLHDPNSVFAKRAAEALERHFDRVVVGAALATVYTGKEGNTAVTAATDGVVQVNATAGLTYDKLLEIDEEFQSKEVGTQMPIRKVLLISEQEHTQLMKEGNLTSGDFSRQYVIDKGQMVRALDFELIVYGSAVPNPILKVVSTTRSCLAIAMGALKIGMTQSWEIDVQPVNNRWHTTQVLASGIMGGIRMEGNHIIEVQTTAS